MLAQLFLVVKHQFLGREISPKKFCDGKCAGECKGKRRKCDGKHRKCDGKCDEKTSLSPESYNERTMNVQCMAMSI